MTTAAEGSAALRRASIALVCCGGLLLVATVIHFAATPLIRDAVLGAITDPAERAYVEGPFLLNHLVVGSLLAAVGTTTVYAARALARGERWSWIVSLVNAAAVATLPVFLLAVMGRQYLAAVPFATAAALVVTAAAVQVGALLSLRRFFR